MNWVKFDSRFWKIIKFIQGNNVGPGIPSWYIDYHFCLCKWEDPEFKPRSENLRRQKTKNVIDPSHNKGTAVERTYVLLTLKKVRYT